MILGYRDRKTRAFAEGRSVRGAVHPGEVLKGELEELGITPTELARQIEVPANRVSQIIAGKRSVTGDTALRFGHWFGVDPQFWLNLQAQYDLVQADRETGPRSAICPPGSVLWERAPLRGVRERERRQTALVVYGLPAPRAGSPCVESALDEARTQRLSFTTSTGAGPPCPPPVVSRGEATKVCSPLTRPGVAWPGPCQVKSAMELPEPLS